MEPETLKLPCLVPANEHDSELFDEQDEEDSKDQGLDWYQEQDKTKSVPSDAHLPKVIRQSVWSNIHIEVVEVNREVLKDFMNALKVLRELVSVGVMSEEHKQRAGNLVIHKGLRDVNAFILDEILKQNSYGYHSLVAALHRTGQAPLGFLLMQTEEILLRTYSPLVENNCPPALEKWSKVPHQSASSCKHAQTDSPASAPVESTIPAPVTSAPTQSSTPSTHSSTFYTSSGITSTPWQRQNHGRRVSFPDSISEAHTPSPVCVITPQPPVTDTVAKISQNLEPTSKIPSPTSYPERAKEMGLLRQCGPTRLGSPKRHSSPPRQSCSKRRNIFTIPSPSPWPMRNSFAQTDTWTNMVHYGVQAVKVLLRHNVGVQAARVLTLTDAGCQASRSTFCRVAAVQTSLPLESVGNALLASTKPKSYGRVMTSNKPCQIPTPRLKRSVLTSAKSNKNLSPDVVNRLAELEKRVASLQGRAADN